MKSLFGKFSFIVALLGMVSAQNGLADIHTLTNMNLGYFVDVLGQASAGSLQHGIFGNKDNPRSNRTILNCETGWQAEDVFSIHCSPTYPSDQNAWMRLDVFNAFSPGENGKLTLSAYGTTTVIPLKCVLDQLSNPSAGAVCQ